MFAAGACFKMSLMATSSSSAQIAVEHTIKSAPPVGRGTVEHAGFNASPLVTSCARSQDVLTGDVDPDDRSLKDPSESRRLFVRGSARWLHSRPVTNNFAAQLPRWKVVICRLPRLTMTRVKCSLCPHQIQSMRVGKEHVRLVEGFRRFHRQTARRWKSTDSQHTNLLAMEFPQQPSQESNLLLERWCLRRMTEMSPWACC
mmetsp:Transcript_17001/g.42772  ORF Transcript_17001/g.42772 Transcript_17001/m.42772 type:complete len:201 (-) Transcript_17001:135-737(-)